MAEDTTDRNDVERLLDNCIQGDEAAWEEFVRRYTGLIRRAIVSRLEASGESPRRHDISDILQNVFVALAGDDRRRLRSLRDRGRPEPWLCIVARNTTVDTLRRKRADRLTKTGDIPETAAPTAANQRRDIHRAEIRQALTEVFAQLTPREQIVLRLTYDHGLKMREIAETIGAPIGTVSSTITRANAKLRDLLRERFPDDLPQ